MDDAERAALNIKFEYERAKKLNAIERGTQIHTEIEAALTDALITGTGVYVVRGEPVFSSKFREQYAGKRIDFMILDDLATHEEPEPSIPKLIAKLALRVVLVIGAAIVALAVIS